MPNISSNSKDVKKDNKSDKNKDHESNPEQKKLVLK